MKICVISPRFAISGVPLAQWRFARALAAVGHEVDLMIGRVDPHLTIPSSPGVHVIDLGRPKVRHMLMPIWRYMRNERPDIVFSAEDHLNTLVILVAMVARSPVKISGSSRVTPFDTYSNTPFTKRWVLKQLSRMTFRRANVLSCVSKDMADQYRSVFGPSAPHVTIYNIVDDATSRIRMTEAIDEPWLTNKKGPVIVAAGSLAPWKGFANLIEAMAMVRHDARLIILGEGPLRGELQAQVDRLGLSDRVKLPGFDINPLKYFARSNVFVLSSTVEGLPNVLVEAMMCGCTPVSTDCPTGPREVLDGGRFGYLVPVGNPDALAAGIERAINHPIAPKLLAEAVRPFEESVIVKRHLELLDVRSGD